MIAVAASLFFYGYWAPKYTLLLIFSMSVNYVLAMMIERDRSKGMRRYSSCSAALFSTSRRLSKTW
mgnify:CR=1 FL=1